MHIERHMLKIECTVAKTLSNMSIHKWTWKSLLMTQENDL